MEEQEDYLDFEFDEDCYSTSWNMLTMWYKRAEKLRIMRENQEKNK